MSGDGDRVIAPTAAEGHWGLWDRRAVMAAGAAMGVLPALPFGAAQAAPLPSSSFHAIVADRRFREARAFATAASRSGQRVAWIGGDITSFWYDELDLA